MSFKISILVQFDHQIIILQIISENYIEIQPVSNQMKNIKSQAIQKKEKQIFDGNLQIYIL